MPGDFQSYTDDAIRAKRVGLLFHARHGQLTSVIHSLGEDVHFLVLIPGSHLIADMIDRAADHQADRVEASLAY